MHAVIKFAAGPLWNVAPRIVLRESERLPFGSSAFQNDQGIDAIEVAHVHMESPRRSRQSCALYLV